MSVLCEGETVLPNAASEPHVVGLCNLLNAMGAQISGIGSNKITIKGVKKLHVATHTIGPDLEVGSFLCLGAIAKGKIRIEDINVQDMRFALKTWKRIGIDPVIGEDYLEIDGTKELVMQPDISGRIVQSTQVHGQHSTDLMSVTIVAATRQKELLSSSRRCSKVECFSQIN